MSLLGISALLFVAFLIFPQLVRGGLAIVFFLVLAILALVIINMASFSTERLTGSGWEPVVSRPKPAADSTSDVTWWGEHVTNITH